MDKENPALLVFFFCPVQKIPQTHIKVVEIHIQYSLEYGHLKDQYSKSNSQHEKTTSKIMNHHRGNTNIAPLVLKELNASRRDWVLLQNSFPICLAFNLEWSTRVTSERMLVCCSVPASGEDAVSFLCCSRLEGHATPKACIHGAGTAQSESKAASSNSGTKFPMLNVHLAPFTLLHTSSTVDEAGLRATTLQPFLFHRSHSVRFLWRMSIWY